MELVLERKEEQDRPPLVTKHGGQLLMTPPINEGYWAYRVRLSETQAIVGFPKFGTIGIGFAVEDDWNTNLPYQHCSAEAIFDHIKRNKGDDSIRDEDCLAAIQLVREAAAADRGTTLDSELDDR
jgi:hypothetical protein